MGNSTRSAVRRFVSCTLALSLLSTSVLANVSYALAGPAVPGTTTAPVDTASRPSVVTSPTVVRELEESRTAESSTYLLSDGSFRQELYTEPVHYEEADGTWDPIDPTLIPTSEFGVTETKATDHVATFATDESTDTPVSITHDDWSVGMKLLGGEQSMVLALGDTADYPLAATDTSLVYQSLPNGIKDTLVLSSPDAPESFTFFLSTTNASVRQDMGGNLIICDSAGEQVAAVAPLLVNDSSGNESGTVDPAVCESATTDVVPVDGGAYITYAMPRSWLDDPARVWPVKVDPSITYTGGNVSCDTFVKSGQPTQSSSSLGYLNVGYTGTTQKTCRSLLRFDMVQIPQGAIISAATLQLYCRTNPNGGNDTVIVDTVTSPWDGNATWNTQPSSEAGTYATMTPGTGYRFWSNCGPIVQKWFDGSRINYGFLIRANNPGTLSQYKQFNSKEFTSPTGQQPHLTVNYTEPTFKVGLFDADDVACNMFGKGEVVRAVVSEVAKNAGPYTSRTEMEIKGQTATGATVSRGRFIWSSYNPNESTWETTQTAEGSWFSFDRNRSGYTSGAVVPRLSDCVMESFDADEKTVTFVYEIGSSYGDIQQNEVWGNTNWPAAFASPGELPAVAGGVSTYSVRTSAPDSISAVTTPSAGWWSEAAGNNDTSTAGRGSATLSWDPAPSAGGYDVYLNDGAQFRKVGSTTATGWSSAGKRLFPSDTAIGSLAADFPFEANGGQTPSAASRLSIDAVPGMEWANLGICVSDGTFAYARSWYTGGVYSWLKIGTGLNGTVAGQNYGRVGPDDTSAKWTLSGMLLGDVLYSGYATSPTTLAGVSKAGDSTTPANNVLTFTRPLVNRCLGTDVTGPDGQILVATAGNRIYNMGYSLSGGAYDGFRVREYTTAGTWVADHTIPMPSFHAVGLIADGDYLYFIEGTNTDTAKVLKVPVGGAQAWTVVGNWTIDQANNGAYNGGYDPVSDRYWMGSWHNNIQSFSRRPGFDLRDDPRGLYAKTPGTQMDAATTYAFKVVPYNGAGSLDLSEVETVTVALENRTKRVIEDARHVGYGLPSIFGDAASTNLDTGEAALDVTDLALPSFGPITAVSRHYSSLSTSTEAAAPGWTFDFQRRVSSATTSTTYWDAVGQPHLFVLRAGGWVAPNGFFSALTRTTDQGWVVTHKDRTTENYSSSGQLLYVADRNGLKTTYTRSGEQLTIRAHNDSEVPVIGKHRRITVRFAPGTNRVLSATLEADGELDRVVTYASSATTMSVTDVSGRLTVYSYDAGSRLSTVAVPAFGDSGASWNLVCDAAGRLSSISNTTGGTTPATARSFSRDSASRTATVTAAGQPQVFKWTPVATIESATIEGSATAVWNYHHDALNLPIREVSPTGRVTSRAHDGNGNVILDVDEMGSASTFHFTPTNELDQSTDPKGSTTWAGYDDNGNLKWQESQLDAQNRSRTEYDYASGGNRELTSQRTKITATMTAETTFSEYAGCGKPETITYVGVKLSSQAASQNLVAYAEYNQLGQVLKQWDPIRTKSGQPLVANEYDLAGRLFSSTDATGTETTYTYDILGGVKETKRSNPASPGVSIDWKKFEFNGDGRPSTDTVLASDGTVTSLGVHRYDQAGRETTVTLSDVPGSEVTTYNAQGLIAAQWDAGADISSETSQASSTRVDYNAEGEPVEVREPGAVESSSTAVLNPDGSVASEKDITGVSSSYLYDANGSLISQSQSSDAGTATVAFDTDLAGRPTTATAANGVVSTNAFDLVGNPISQGLGSQAPSGIAYNSLGWVLTQTDFDGVSTALTYDKDGRVLTRDVAGLVTTTDYDDFGRVVHKHNPDGSSVAYVYDLFGRLTSEKQVGTDGVDVCDTTTTYDGASRAKYSEDLITGVIRTYSYAATGTVTVTTSRRDGDALTTNRMNGVGLLSSIQASFAGSSLDWSVTATDSAGRTRDAASTTLNHDWRIRYDEVGRPVWDGGTAMPAAAQGVSAQGSPPVGPPPGEATSTLYAYSKESGKKTADNFGFQFGQRTERNSYTYDLTGKLKSATVAGIVTTYSYDSATGAPTGYRRGSEATTTLTYANGRLTAAGSRVYSSDQLGRRKWEGPSGDASQTAYTWNADRLSTVTGPRGQGRYTYDANGQRTRSVVTSASITTTTTFDYQATRLLGLAATRSNGTTYAVDYLYDDAGAVFAGTYSGSDATAGAVPFMLVTTDKGDVRELLDAAGSPIAFYSYDAYGNPVQSLSATSSLVPSAGVAARIAERQPLRWASYAYDAESGNYYLSARYYDPSTLQFISRDPIKADAEESLYQYCSGDPVQNTDPTGFEMLGYMISMEAHAGMDVSTAYAFHSNGGSKKARAKYSKKRAVAAKKYAKKKSNPYQDFETKSRSGKAWKKARAAENKRVKKKVAAVSRSSTLAASNGDSNGMVADSEADAKAKVLHDAKNQLALSTVPFAASGTLWAIASAGVVGTVGSGGTATPATAPITYWSTAGAVTFGAAGTAMVLRASTKLQTAGMGYGDVVLSIVPGGWSVLQTLEQSRSLHPGGGE